MFRLDGRLLAVTAFFVAAACSGGPKPDTRPAPPDPQVGDGSTGGPAAPSTTPRAKAIEQPKLLEQPLPNDPAKVTIHRLSNGMTVYISPDSQEPTVTAYVAVRTGGRNDPANSTGLAHYLEHMLFKGTSKLGTLDYAKEKPHLDRIAQLYADLRKPGADRDKILKAIDEETQKAAAYEVPNELDALYSQIGIKGLNAYTNLDSTVYTVEVPKNRLAQWAKVEVERYIDPVFRLFWPELEAVYEEKNRGLDNPGRRVYEAMMLGLFPKHGYSQTVLGHVEHLKSPAYGDMEAYFYRYYTPQNMAILLAGDVDASILPLLEKEFGRFQRKAGDAPDAGELSPLPSRTEVAVPVPSNEGVILAWPTVKTTHPDRLALDVMDRILFDGKGGIIMRDLLLPQKVTNAASSPTFLRESGYFQISADALTGQSHADLEKLLLGVVDKLQAGDFTDKDVATAVLHDEINLQRQLESNDGRMDLLTEAFVQGEDWSHVVGRIDAMKQVTKADIVRVAKQYLTKNMLVLRRVKGQATPPKIQKPGITAVKVDTKRQSPFAKSILAMEAAPIEPVALVEGKDFARAKLATGPLVAVTNTRNGLFSIGHQYEYGRSDDKLVCLALEVLKVSGAGKRSAEQTARELHELGISVDTRCSKNDAEITISGIDRNLEPGMALLREWLASPAFDDATLKARVAASLTERANQVGSPQAIANAQQQFARFGNDSDFLVVATNKDMQAAKPEQLKKSLKKFLTLKHRTTYFGPRDAATAAKVVTLGDGKAPARAQRPTKYRRPNIVLATDQPTQQTHVWLVWPKRPANDNDRAAGAVFGNYISEQLYQEVREARGLAYTTYGGYGAGRKIDETNLFAYVGTQGDKTHDALDAVLSTLRQPLDDVRLTRAKETIAQGHRTERIPPRFVATMVYQWEDQGAKGDPRAARIERIAKLDRATLQKWLDAALKLPVIVSITGDRKKLDEPRLQKLAPVTFVPVEKLFGY